MGPVVVFITFNNMSDDQVKIEKEKQEKVQQKRENCDHVGYYVGHGFEIINVGDGGIVGVSAINCMMCGAVFYPKGEIIPPMPKEGKKLLQ